MRRRGRRRGAPGEPAQGARGEGITEMTALFCSKSCDDDGLMLFFFPRFFSILSMFNFDEYDTRRLQRLFQLLPFCFFAIFPKLIIHAGAFV